MNKNYKLETNIKNNNLGTAIYENESGYQVYFHSVLDTTSKRQSFLILIQSPDGEFSEPIHMKRSTFFNSKKALNFLLDYEGDFTQDDILAVHMAIQENLECVQKNSLKLKEKLPIKEVYVELCKYIYEKASDEDDAQIRIEDNFGYIRTPHFKTVFDEFKWMGYKEREILLQFQLLGVLVTYGNGSYSSSKRFGGEPKRYYCFRLPEVIPEEAEETVPEKVEETLCA